MTKEELKTLNEQLKKVPSEKRPVVRRMLSADIPLTDALTVVNAFIPSTSQNKPVSGSDTIKSTIATEKPLEKPINGSESDSQEKNQLERVKDSPVFDIDDINLKVRESIQIYCLQHDMENTDMIKAPQRIWGACSSFIGKNVFKASSILKSTVLKQVAGQVNPTTNGAYDLHHVADVINLYCDLCNEYNKTILMDYVALFCGVSDSWLYESIEKLTLFGVDLQKKRELSLASYISDSKTNVTGALACLNHWHGWSGTGSHTVERKETVIIYPSLSSDLQNNSPQIATIQPKQAL